ncbi:5'-3' exoribonuclease 1 [Diorhabda carinulata]|uniref:5'-3' exoribonuclease 1 n=1 Tax=Diorhabda carinulata TaxID=1163345 RepID=UPI0025A22226|nr:5'-3' exoribonuclease 1 [Diorhabda carinulata]XP_057669655.1 5'-3' exoribonuclease 1 [Diorhabda carinulata]
MGVPKFYRYISERYPCLSELIKDYQIPEFDNLYLDMNGIIHNCSHPNDEDPHFRITEEKIFQDIFHYIEVLFRMIKPQKLFFMAVDGVAPRAKMNQQRGRRFRSAADAAKAEAEVLKKGETLPTEARFDSNCITPGTVFMAKLHEQLKYFVVDKISNDPLWQKCKVILSGHETPGEGEHKIMDYIRYMRAQPGYNPNTRHCLYGLDADLIMLGLCTHEPHFSLLREEVKFGKKSTKHIKVPEEITFFLLHLSLLREYLELEFAPIRYNLRGFDYDLEKIIDDWVLMGFLVGNDFIPHLPNLHISEGALPILYRTYMEVLPTLDGYINESGTLNLKRFAAFLDKLSVQDVDYYEQVKDDILYLESKRGHKNELTRELDEWEAEDDNVVFESLEPETSVPKDGGLINLLKSADDLCIDDDDDYTSDDDFANFKKDYYKSKMEYMDVTPEVLKDQAEGYVRAIQWNLNYYYNGCCSWSWYYPHHYAPYISDIKNFIDLKIEFDMGKPFQAYEQLLAVLPAASKQLLPECYHDLMTAENSLIIDYYPEKFETDLNGKKQAWEAVVKIPFIDEKRLLEAMQYYNDKLTTEERKRNTHGPMLIYTYTPKNNGPYPAPCYFPEVAQNHTEVKTLKYDDILISKEELVKGAYPGAHMNVYYPGFPTMKHLHYRGELQKAHVKVFEQPSRNESMIIYIVPDAKFTGDMIPVDLLGTNIFVGWPHLIEAKVVAISNYNIKFISMGGPNQYNTVDLTESDRKQFQMTVNGISQEQKSRMGINLGDTKVLVYVKQLIGRKFTVKSNGKLYLEKQFASNISAHPLQTIVYNISFHDPLNNVTKDVENIFPKNSICFTLTNPYYGSQGEIIDSSQVATTARIKISVSVLEEPDLSKIKEMHDTMVKRYKPAHQVANPLCISNILFSKITGSIFVKPLSGYETRRVNIGLDLKLNKKNKETPGYTKKVNNYWYYTDKAAELVMSYIDMFPEVLECLSKNMNNDDIRIESIFVKNCEERFKELQEWLKTLPTNSIEKQTCNSINLEPEVVQELEKMMDSFKSGSTKKVTMQVRPNFLYRPEIQNGTLEPDPKTETRILDRIVNVRYGYTVPFGYKGTVTAIRTSSTNNSRDTMYEVIFDKPFRDGLKLNCLECRGYLLPKTAFINLSYGQRLMVEKTGKPDELIAKAEATTNSNYFNNLIKPQPSFQKQEKTIWNPPQFQQSNFFFSPLNQPEVQSNSAFAHFNSINAVKKPVATENDSNNFNVTEFFNKHKQNEQSQTKNVNTVKKNVKNDSSFLNTHGNSGSSEENKSNYQKLMKPEDFRAPPNNQSEENSNQPNSKRNERQKEFPQNNNKVPNDFMPAFGSKKEHKQQGHPSVDTNFLKNLLKIGSQDNVRTVGNKGNVASNNFKDEEKSANVSFDMLAQVANTPASVRLLTYYQSNQLGLPRYQYFPVKHNMIQAQITLNDGKILVSEPKKTREDASENVAAIVLKDFLKKGKGMEMTNNHEHFPAPPTNWVNSNTDNGKQKIKKSIKNDATAVLNNSFVPLQAVKNHISKTNNTKLGDNVKQVASTNVQDEPAEVKHIEEKNKNRIENRPKKERKTRIAANFVKNN